MNGFSLLPDAEWLETDGLGGYALSTVSGRNARRYHGLLVSATTPPTGRAVLLAKLEETLVVGEERFDLVHRLVEIGPVGGGAFEIIGVERDQEAPEAVLLAGEVQLAAIHGFDGALASHQLGASGRELLHVVESDGSGGHDHKDHQGEACRKLTRDFPVVQRHVSHPVVQGAIFD